MRLLVSITSYFPNKIPYVQQLLNEYNSIQQTLNAKIDVVLACNYSHTFEKNELNVTYNPEQLNGEFHAWSNYSYVKTKHPYYDYIIESDDDILITAENIRQYIKWESVSDDLLPGFLVYEKDETATIHIQSVLLGEQFVERKATIGQTQYFSPTNVHSACYMIDSRRFERCKLPSIPGNHQRYDVQCTARSFVYIDNYTKFIPISEIDSHLVHHLTNRYLSIDDEAFPRSRYKSLDYWKSVLHSEN